jgi:hypothetical protein
MASSKTSEPTTEINPERKRMKYYLTPTLVPCAHLGASGAFGHHLDGRGNMMTMHD